MLLLDQSEFIGNVIPKFQSNLVWESCPTPNSVKTDQCYRRLAALFVATIQSWLVLVMASMASGARKGFDGAQGLYIPGVGKSS